MSQPHAILAAAALALCLALAPTSALAADPPKAAPAPAPVDAGAVAQAKVDAGTAKPATDAGIAEVPPTSPCAQDAEAFCDGIPQGQGDVLRCLVGKSDQLSVTCKAKLQQIKKDFLAGADACDADIQAFCASVPKTGGRIAQCLMSKKKDLSNNCRDLITKLEAGK